MAIIKSVKHKIRKRNNMFEKYTLEAQKILTMAESIAFSFGNDEVSEGHLLLAFLKNEENEVSKALADYNIDENIIKNKLMEESEEKEFAAPIYMAYNFKLKKILDDCMKIKENENVISTFVLGFSLLKNLDDSYFQILQIEDKNEVLKKYKKLYKRCSNLDKIVELHRMGDRKLDPLIGREEILDELITTLKRRNKPNPILVGEPGVGKSFIVEHLSKKINEGEIKELQGKVVFELDLPSAVSGTKYRGEFEEKIKKIIQKVIDEKNVILFIDEIHNIVKAGGAEGAIDCSNIIKPYLSRGEIQIIGATTYEEYEKVFSTDKALKRRFQIISIKENSREETLDILNVLIPIYAKYYGKNVSDGIGKFIVECADKHLPNLSFPDKAIDILDNSLALTKKDLLTFDEIKTCMKKIYHVDLDFNFNYANIFQDLKKEIFGQDKALNQLEKSMTLCMNQKQKGVLGCFLFIGPSGVGKTYLAKKLGEKLFCDESHFLKMDMAGYKDCSAIIGSSPGFVGYKEESILIKTFTKCPNSLILLDEIEKASPQILDLFLSIFEEGYFYSSFGKKIDCSNAIFILTGNIGFSLNDELHFQFSNSQKNDEKMLLKYFKFEFLSRLDDIIYFNYLDEEAIVKIEKEYLKSDDEISIDNTVINETKKYGARAIIKNARYKLLEKKMKKDYA